MEIRKNIHGDQLEMIVPGRVDGAMANQLEIEILAALRQGTKNIFVNLVEATLVCSAGLRVLLQYHRQAKAQGKTLMVTRPSAEVAAAIEMTGFSGLVEK